MARLLAEIGAACGRFPTPEALTCLAGAAPSTRQSGKVRIVGFRWAVDKQLGGAVIDFAGDSRAVKRRSRTTAGREGCSSWRTSFHAAILRR
ncbi:transposase [Micromonospora parva]|uniref:transposase n=1 Tax=Micromonospora parva TaxID=1464048 RepID=UPI0033FAB207